MVGIFDFKKRKAQAKIILAQRREEKAKDFAASLRRKAAEKKAFREEKEKVAVQRARERAKKGPMVSQVGKSFISGLDALTRPPMSTVKTVRKKKGKKSRKVTKVVEPKPIDIFGGGW